MNDNLGERILQLRIRLQLTQKELARLFDVASLTVSRWERKKSRPMPVHLRKMERLERKARKIKKGVYNGILEEHSDRGGMT